MASPRNDEKNKEVAGESGRDSVVLRRPSGVAEEDWTGLLQAISRVGGMEVAPAPPNSARNSGQPSRGSRSRSPRRTPERDGSRHNSRERSRSPGPGNAQDPSTLSARASTPRGTAIIGTSPGPSDRSYGRGPPRMNRYNGTGAQYSQTMTMPIPRPPSLIRCPPFAKDFTRLGTHLANLPRTWYYYSRRYPLSFSAMERGKKRSGGDLFRKLSGADQVSTWNRYVNRFDGMYAIPYNIPSGLHFIYDSSHAEYLIRLNRR